MSEQPDSQARIARLAPLLGVASFVIAAVALALAQGADVVADRACLVSTWAPMRGLPWVVVAALPWIVNALVFAVAARRRPSPVTLGEGPYRRSVLDEAPRLERPRRHVYVRVLLGLLALAAGVAEGRRWSCPYAVPASCHPKTSRIAIMAVGKVDPRVVAGLADHFRDCYALPVSVAPPMEAPPTAWNAKRGQWTAEALLAAMPGCQEGDPLCDASVLVIGVTSEEIYTTQHDWRYAFTTRDPARHTAILSTANLSSLAPGSAAARLRKLAAKTIALEYCGLPQTDNPRSVRYDAIMGPDELDAIDESVW